MASWHSEQQAPGCHLQQWLLGSLESTGCSSKHPGKEKGLCVGFMPSLQCRQSFLVLSPPPPKVMWKALSSTQRASSCVVTPHPHPALPTGVRVSQGLPFGQGEGHGASPCHPAAVQAKGPQKPPPPHLPSCGACKHFLSCCSLSSGGESLPSSACIVLLQ